MFDNLAARVSRPFTACFHSTPVKEKVLPKKSLRKTRRLPKSKTPRHPPIAGNAKCRLD